MQAGKFQNIVAVRKFYSFIINQSLEWSKHLLLIMLVLSNLPAWADTTSSPVVVTDQVTVTYTGLSLNRATNTFDTQATLSNKSNKAIQIPIQLVISNISQATVSLANAGGALADGTPYISIPFGDGVLSPGETVKGIQIKFNNPKRLGFTFSQSVMGVLPASNHPPIANAGSDITATVGTQVTLSAVASSDEDGNTLTYRWRILEKPVNSIASLDNTDAIQPKLLIDRKGNYRIELIVNDGQIDSAAVVAVITTENSKPLARAGDDQTIKVKQTVYLDGINSSDIDQDNLNFQWQLLGKPTDSGTSLKNQDTQTPNITPDKPGNYTLQLIVNDGLLDSLPDQLIVSTENSKPIADAGFNQSGTVGRQITLDGTQSIDVDNDPLSYVWSLLTKPVNSSVELISADRVQALLTPDLPGDYVAQLIVNDTKLNSDAATSLVTVSVAPPVNHAPQITSNPPLTATIGNLYSYDVDATDSDNDALIYSLSLFSTGMSINTQTGIISWTPTAGQTGSQSVNVKVSDDKGGSDSQSFSISVAAADQTTVPNLANQTRATAEAAIQQAKLNIGTLTFQHNAKADGQVINQSPLANSKAIIGAVVNLTVSLGPDNGLPSNPATIAPTLDQTVASTTYDASQFLYTGSNPIQTGVQPGTIEAKRAAVIRGKVLDMQNNPLSGVTVSIKDHPELGQSQTRTDGQYDLAVNGGGVLTVNLVKSGFLPAQRTLSNVPWQDYATVEEAILLAKDNKVTTVDLNSPDPIKVAQGSVVSDNDGSRQASLLLPLGLTAEVYNPDGSKYAVQQLSLRFTEYTVGANGPKQMPGPLPPTSGYTYALEISADEAANKFAGTDVLLSQPVPFYVDNFLNMPVGIQVPVAYYDSEKAAWIPSDDGRVIKILNIANGMANLDTDGDGSADDGTALGVTVAERTKLAQLYPAGQSLWRVMLAHLSTYDLNYGVSAQQGAVQPSNLAPKSDSKPQCQSQQPGSIIGCEGQTLSEEIGVTGTPFFLRYDSERMSGRKAAYNLDIPLSGATVPGELKRIELEISLAGRSFTKTYTAQANLAHHFEWDGLDAYGRVLQGRQLAHIKIDYVYDGYYNMPPSMASSFGAASGQKIAGNIPARQEIKLTQIQTENIGITTNIGLGAWSLNTHHRYDPTSKTLYLGDGSIRDAQNSALNTSVITTVAGTGVAGYSGDGAPAINAKLNRPSGIAVGRDGSLYVTDFYGVRIRRVSPNGNIETIAGTGISGFSGDNGPAINARISNPDSLVVGPDEALYFVDVGNNRVRRINKEGIITTVAGSGLEGFSGDGGTAIDAKLDFNGTWHGGGVALQADGTLLIADLANYRIRKVAPGGIITTIAGTGVSGGSGDAGAATNAKLFLPIGVTVSLDGSTYIYDGLNGNKIRRIGNDGIITTFAGNGIEGFSGDGGSATNASLDFIAGSWGGGFPIAQGGKFYIPDTGNHRIRMVSSDGRISTIAGTGVAGFSGDNSTALAAKLNAPTGIAIVADGSIVFTDALNNRVRRIAPALPGVGITDIAIPSQDGSELYRFDSSGRHLETKDTLTGKVLLSFSYDQSGQLTKITDADNNVTTIERDNVGSPAAIISAFGQRTALSLDSNGYLSAVTNPAGETYQATYTVDGLLTKFENPRHYASVMTYDAMGKLVSDTNAENGSQTLARTGLGNGYQVTHTSSNGRKTIYSVENLTGEERRQTTFPDGTVSVMSAKADGTTVKTAADGSVSTSVSSSDPRFGMLAPVTSSQKITTGNLTTNITSQRTVVLNNPDDPLSIKTLTDSLILNGRTATSTFDALSQTLTLTSPGNRVSKTLLDAKGRITQTQVTGILATNTSYDAQGRLESISQGTGIDQRKLDYSYNPQGYLASMLDPIGRQVQFQYDQAGRVTTQTLTDGRQILYSYDANGNLVALTPPGQPAHLFNYTGIDQASKYLPPTINAGTNDTVYTYDKDKALVSIARPDGQNIDLNHDSAGRVSSLLLSPANQTLASYVYDTNTGKLTGVTAPDAGLAFTYNGALLTQTAWTGAVTGSVGYSYDNDFRITSVNLNGANAIAYTYDADSLLTKAGNLTLTRSAQNGMLTGTALGSTTEAYSVNSFGELSGYEAKYSTFSHLKLAYSHDKLGRITQKQETTGGILNTFDYGYDTAGRLVEVKKNTIVQASYSYDDNGNRLSHSKGGVTENGTYDAQDRLLTYNGTDYSYTANGELLTKTVGAAVTSYDYDVLGNLKKVVLPSGSSIDYLIDGQNRRIGKKVNGNLIQAFLWQGPLQLIAELDGSGNVVSRFVYATGVNVPDYMTKGGVTYRIIKDHLGSPRVVVDVATNTVAQEMDYDEFGRVTKDTNPGFQPFGFAGGLYDKDTKLVRFGARDYDAVTGRWTNKDPIGFGGNDSNVYAYVGGNPVNFIDPLGLYCTYSQSTGDISCTNAQGQPYYNEQGYAGTGNGRNNPNAQAQQSVGPLPRGQWQVNGPWRNSPNTGRNTITLTPLSGNECLSSGRDCSSFRIHGNNRRNDASHGCIVLPPNRTTIPPGEIIEVVR